MTQKTEYRLLPGLQMAKFWLPEIRRACAFGALQNGLSKGRSMGCKAPVRNLSAPAHSNFQHYKGRVDFLKGPVGFSESITTQEQSPTRACRARIFLFIPTEEIY